MSVARGKGTIAPLIICSCPKFYYLIVFYLNEKVKLQKIKANKNFNGKHFTENEMKIFNENGKHFKDSYDFLY